MMAISWCDSIIASCNAKLSSVEPDAKMNWDTGSLPSFRLNVLITAVAALVS